MRSFVEGRSKQPVKEDINYVGNGYPRGIKPSDYSSTITPVSYTHLDVYKRQPL